MKFKIDIKICYNNNSTMCYVKRQCKGEIIMKITEKHQSSAEIVLNDKELSLIIRRLIDEATKKSYNKTSVTKAISKIWSDIVPKEDKVRLDVTIDEQTFFNKVDIFFSEYGQKFVDELEILKDDGWSKNNSMKKTNLLRYLKVFAKSMYCVFHREDTITFAYINKYCKMLDNHGYVIKEKELYLLARVLNKIVIVDNKLIYDTSRNIKYFSFHPDH